MAIPRRRFRNRAARVYRDGAGFCSDEATSRHHANIPGASLGGIRADGEHDFAGLISMNRSQVTLVLSIDRADDRRSAEHTLR